MQITQAKDAIEDEEWENAAELLTPAIEVRTGVISEKVLRPAIGVKTSITTVKVLTPAMEVKTGVICPQKTGLLMIMHSHCPHLRPCTSHIFFWISFKFYKWLAMAVIWPPYSFGSPGVEVMLWGVRNMQKL